MTVFSPGLMNSGRYVNPEKINSLLHESFSVQVHQSPQSNWTHLYNSKILHISTSLLYMDFFSVQLHSSLQSSFQILLHSSLQSYFQFNSTLLYRVLSVQLHSSLQSSFRFYSSSTPLFSRELFSVQLHSSLKSYFQFISSLLYRVFFSSTPLFSREFFHFNSTLLY